MLTEVRFHNVKALADVTVPLERLTVLVGANGAGKSTALEGILRAAELGRDEDGPRQAWNGLRARTHAPQGADEVGVTGKWLRDGSSVAMTVTDHKTRRGEEVTALVSGSRFSGQPNSEKLLGRLAAAGIFHGLTARLFRFSVPRLREASLQRTAEPRMEDDGTGMATVLSGLLKRDRDAFARLEADLRAVVPQVRRVAIESAQVEASSNAYGDLAAVDIEGVGRVTAPDLSEGTLLTLALLTELHRPGGADILLLDDLDRGLHPRAQADLLGCLRALMTRRPSLQVVATAHSPYLLDHLEPGEVVVMALDGASRAHAKRLSDHPDHDRMAALLRTGEFWASVGEDWVTGEAEEPVFAAEGDADG